MVRFIRKCRVILVLTLLFLLLGCKRKQEKKSLLLYCAAVVKPVLEEVAKAYYEETGVQVALQYGGSGTLLANIRVAKQGDLYLSADASYMQKATEYNLIKESKPLAPIAPILAVAKGNPKNIKQLKDVCAKDIRFSIANPSAASIGRVTKNMLITSGDWSIVENCIYVQMPTVSDVANALKLKTVDVGIIWNVTANQYKEIEIVAVDFFKQYIENVTIGVLKSSEQPNEALKFMDYLVQNPKNKSILKRLGYTELK